jgi:hypothetical protein
MNFRDHEQMVKQLTQHNLFTNYWIPDIVDLHIGFPNYYHFNFNVAG